MILKLTAKVPQLKKISTEPMNKNAISNADIFDKEDWITINSIKSLKQSDWYKSGKKWGSKISSIFIDVSGYDGKEDLKLALEFLERVDDAREFTLKLGGWQEGMTFNEAFE